MIMNMKYMMETSNHVCVITQTDRAAYLLGYL